ncbi:MAG: response regulator [Pirellulaceae bacterium]|nr:response regulator [Pirellulaceae bacterium]
MDELRVLLVGQSTMLAEVIAPELSVSLPKFRFQAVARARDALPEMATGRVIASLAFVRDSTDEAAVAELLHAVQAKRLSVPVFVITSEDDVFQRLRFLEWGAVDCLGWPLDLSRLATLIWRP